MLYFVGNIYAVVSPRDNSWGGDYWLAHCLEGNKTLNISFTSDEGNGFLLGWWLLTMNIYHRIISKEKCVYVFQYYRLGASMYNFMNLVIGKNLQLKINTMNNSSKLQYLLSHSKHDNIMETTLPEMIQIDYLNDHI